MTKPLTDAAVKSELPTPARREVPDGKIGGLYLVVQPSGAKSWALRYRIAGAPKKLTIGAYPAINLATARRLAQKAAGDIAEGSDPAAGKQAAKAAAKAEREAQTDRVEHVVEQFIKCYAETKTRDWQETKRILEKEVVGRWRGRRLSQIDSNQVQDMIDEIAGRGAPVGANCVFAQFRAMCGWAVKRRIIGQNPCAGKFDLSPERRRERVLSDDEIRAVWSAFETVGWPFGPIGKIFLFDRRPARRSRRNALERSRSCQRRLEPSGRTVQEQESP